MNENESYEGTEVIEVEVETNFESNEESVRVEPTFPITKKDAAKFLGRSDVMIGKDLKQIEDTYSNISPEKMFSLTDERGRITEIGFNELIQLHRHSGKNYPDYDLQTGKIHWDENGQPRMMENKNRIPVAQYLKNLTEKLGEKNPDRVTKNTGVEIVPVEIDVETLNLDAHSRKMNAIETMNRVEQIQKNTSARYTNMRAMRRRNIAAQALQDSAEDLELYSKIYDANISKGFNDQASGLDNNNNSD